MKTPFGMEVDLGPGDIVLDRGPSSRERGTAAPLFSAHVYCGHGRPSQLLLSSCTNGCQKAVASLLNAGNINLAVTGFRPGRDEL